jgi:hypothetical protein
MELIDVDQFLETVNEDPEFKIAARFWDTLLKIEMGDRHGIFTVLQGEITRVNLNPGPRDPWKIKIEAPEEDWRKFLEAVPRPFYHDLAAASAHHGFNYQGDIESFNAYYPAIRRMFEVMRSCTVSHLNEGESS